MLVWSQERYIDALVANTKTVRLSGVVNESVLLNPPGCIKTQSLKEEGQFTRLDGLTEKKIDFRVSYFWGLPNICLVCGETAMHYSVYKSIYQNLNGKEFTISNGFSPVTESDMKMHTELIECYHECRDYLVVPVCASHSEVPIYYKADGLNRSFFTDTSRIVDVIKRMRFPVTSVTMIHGNMAYDGSNEYVKQQTDIVHHNLRMRNLWCLFSFLIILLSGLLLPQVLGINVPGVVLYVGALTYAVCRFLHFIYKTKISTALNNLHKSMHG